MRMTLNLFRKTLQRHGESPWEVVGRYDIAPVSMYDDDEGTRHCPSILHCQSSP